MSEEPKDQSAPAPAGKAEDAPKISRVSPENYAANALSRVPGGRFLMIGLGFLALGVPAIKGIQEAFDWFEAREEAALPMPGAPRIVMVSPTEPAGHFAVLHVQGLEMALQKSKLGTQVVLGGHAQEDFKSGNLETILTDLRKQLETNEVIAVIAPSITEATYDVVRTVQESGLQVPVFLESAIPWTELQRFQEGPPLFRLSSGIGERGETLAAITKQLDGAGLQPWLFYERVNGDKSYGVRLKDSILTSEHARALPPSRVVPYDSTNLDAALAQVPLGDPNAVVFVLGVATDFERIVTRAYPASGDAEARIIGVMNAHEFPSLFESMELKEHLVFDLCDVEISSTDGRGDRVREFYDHYTTGYGKPGPTHRDQAFSFDAGLILDRAFYASDLSDLDYSEGLELFAEAIASLDLHGVTGSIHFEHPREGMQQAYQNRHGHLQVVRMGRDEDGAYVWEAVDLSEWKP